MAGLLIVVMVLFILYRWGRYRRSPCYREQLRAWDRLRRCEDRLRRWSRVAAEVDQYLAQATQLEERACAALADQMIEPRRAAMLAVENLRQFKGIGPDTVGLLQANGYVSAERIDEGILRIPGIGPAKAERILAAAQQLRAAAAALQPNDEERAAIVEAQTQLREQYASWVGQLRSLREELAPQVARRTAQLEAQRQVVKEVRRFSFLRYLLTPRRADAELAAFLRQHPAPEPGEDHLPPAVPAPPKSAPAPATPHATPHAIQTQRVVPTESGPSRRFVEVTQAAAVPAPSPLPRPTDGPRAQRPASIRVQWKRSSQFIQDSLRYRSPAPKPVPYVPFQQYWPTFATMSQRQLAYYRWWRTEWLSGRKVPVDPSYIFVFVYELLNCSFEEDPFKAYQLLCRLFESYREEHPVLWRYAEWVGDMAWELRLEDEAVAWYSRDDTTYDVALSLARDRGIGVFPVPVLMSAFGVRPSAHFNRHAEEITTLLETALHEAEEWCRTTLKRPLLDALAGGNTLKATRDLYRSAVIERRLMRRGPGFTVYRGRRDVTAGVQALFRVVENLHREATGVNRKLQVDPAALPQPLVQHLVNWLRQRMQRPAPHPVVQFDASVLAALHRDSSVVQSLLTSALSEEVGEEVQPAAFRSAAIAAPPMASAPGAAPALADLLAGGSGGGMEELFAALNSDQVEFLRLFRHGKPVDKAVAMEFVRDRGGLFVSFVDRINEVALEPLGDNLLEETDDEVRVAEPFVAEFIAYWRGKEAH